MNASLYNPTISKKGFAIQTLYILIVLLTIGAVIRFFGLTYSGLWLDEIYSMIGSDPSTTLSDVYQYSTNDQPPLFFILLHGWLKIFGYTDFAGRALACVFGLFGIIAMFFIGYEFKGEKLGLFAALITTINWYHTDISKEIRFYPLVFLLTALSYLFFLRSVKGLKMSNFFFYTLFTALLLNTHYFGLVVLLSQLLIFIYILVFFKRVTRLIVRGLIAGGAAGLSLWHWLPIIMGDLQITTFHVKPVSFNFPLLFVWDYFKDPIAVIVYTFCLFLVIYDFYRKVTKGKLAIEHVVVIGWIFLAIAIPLIYSLVKVPLLTSKYSTIVVPAILLVIANGFTLFKSEKLKLYCVAFVIFSAIIVLFFARPPYKPRRGEDWREVAFYFSNRDSSKEIIFSQLAWFHTYYFKKMNHTLPIDQNTCDLNSIISKTDQLSLLTNERYSGGWLINGFPPEQKKIINEKFELKDSTTFKQTKVFLYLRKKERNHANIYFPAQENIFLKD